MTTPRHAEREAQVKQVLEDIEDCLDYNGNWANYREATSVVVKLISATERAVWEEAAKMLDAEAETILQEWSDDASVPKQTHEAVDCRDRCDGYALCHMTFSVIAQKLRQRAQEVEGG